MADGHESEIYRIAEFVKIRPHSGNIGVKTKNDLLTMKKKIIKPFSVEEWRNGAKVETRNGRPVRLLCTDYMDSDYPVVGIVSMCEGAESISTFTLEGRHNIHREEDRDLVIVEEVEEPERWADDKNVTGEGWYIGFDSTIWEDETALNDPRNFNEFATERQAKSALAMARISQLMKNDSRYGGVVTDEEWMNPDKDKHCIARYGKGMEAYSYSRAYYFLAFHTPKQRDLFLEENERLVKDYLMID